MKIKTQFIACIAVFTVILLVVGTSVAMTEQQVAQLHAQEIIASSIERGASSLNIVSIDYFLYQEDLQLSRWQSSLTSLSNDLSNLKTNTPQQQTFANSIADDLQRLNSLFDDVTAYLQAVSRNVSVRIDPAFQIRWSSMAVQSQALAFDASQLSRSLNDQSHQVSNTNSTLIVSLVGIFGAFLVTIYLMFFRRTLKSVAELQNGINTIGSGNLDYVIETKREDEIAELSHSFNQMTSNLKTVTASKAALENEVNERKKAEEALRRQASLIDLTPDAIIVMKPEGTITFWSEGAKKLYGWTKTEAVGQTSHALLKTRFPEALGNVTSQIRSTGQWSGELQHTTKDGRYITVQSSWLAEKDEQEEVKSILESNVDITQRKQMQAKLEEYSKKLEKLVDERTKKLEQSSMYARNLIEASLDPLVTISEEGKITDVNMATEEATGCGREELIGSDFCDYFTEPEQARAGYQKVFTDGFVKDYPLAIKHKTGRITYVLYNASVYRSPKGDVQGVFAAARDITELKRAEEQAQEAAKKLKDAERLAAIGATAGMVGHDIRNPLQSIVGDIYLAKDDVASLPKSEEKEGIKESLQAIEKSVDYVNKIVADLQDFAKPLNPHMEETDLNGMISDLLKNKLPDNIKRRVKIAKETQTLTTDSAYLRRILGNLITNAIQAMPNGGNLAINATAKDNNTIITVQDTGIGIPEEAKPKLFQPLFTTKSKGQGFGLSVVKRMTEALNGTVTFESQQGKGTKFTIQIPTDGKPH